MEKPVKKYRHWSAPEITRMIALYEDEFLSLTEVGAEFGLSPTRISRIFDQYDVPRRKRTNSRKLYASFEKKRTVFDRETLCKLYTAENLSLENIAERLGTTYAVIERNFKEYKIRRRKPGRSAAVPLTRELLAYLYLDLRLTVTQVAARLGVTDGAVRKKLYDFRLRKTDIKTAAGSVPGNNPYEATGDGAADNRDGKNKRDRNARTDETQAGQNGAFEREIQEKSTALLTVPEVAILLKRRPVTIQRLACRGAFPNAFRQIKKHNRPWLIPAADLVNYQSRPLTDLPLSTVLSRLAAARKQIRKLHGYGKTEILEMIKLEEEGSPAAEIAVRFDLPETLVEDILRGCAVKPPRVKKQLPAKRPPKRLPKELLIELYVEKNLPMKEILEKLETNYASFYINLRHYDIPLRTRHYRLAAAETENTLRRLTAEKLSPPEIAVRLNMTESYIRRKLREIKLKAN